MGYNFLSIENFRAIAKLDISDLKRINLLVGKNNSGKSTILEAFFLLTGMSNPQIPWAINELRDLLIGTDEDFKYIFHNLDLEIPIKLSGEIAGKTRQASFTPSYENISEIILGNISNNKEKDMNNLDKIFSASTSYNPEATGITSKFTNHENKEFKANFSIKYKKFTLSNKYKEDISCEMLIPSKIMISKIDQKLTKIIQEKKLDPIITVLQKIEPKLEDIRLVSNSMTMVDLGENELFPLNIMGDGMRKILSIIVTILENKNGVVLIDEIENGLHYSSLSIAWEAIIEACRLANVQLIATTHSYECISALGESLEKEPDTDEVSLYRVEKENHQHFISKADLKMILAGMEINLELR